MFPSNKEGTIMRRTVSGLLCLLFSCLPVMADDWDDASLLIDTQSASHFRYSLAIRCDDTFGLPAQAMKRLAPEQIENNPTIWRTEMQRRQIGLTPDTCLT
jgi:hypothetical protein